MGVAKRPTNGGLNTVSSGQGGTKGAGRGEKKPVKNLRGS